MVRTTLGAEVETTVTVSGSESVDFIDATQSGTVSAGNTEIATVSAPTGFIYELLALKVTIPIPGSATSGSHDLLLTSQEERINRLFMQSDNTANLTYDNGVISSANTVQKPPNNVSQTLATGGLRADDTNGYRLRYRNGLDVDQPNDRRYKLWARQIEVGE